MTSLRRAAAFAAFVVMACPPGLAQDTMRYLDNGHIRVGIDLAMGGAITYLSKSGTSDNVVNSFDAGREIQQSYYSGPNDFGNWSGQPWPWNPISVGDQWGNHSQLLDFQTDGQTLYTRIIPMQWGGSNPAGTLGDCTLENWVTIEGNVVHVRNRLNNARTDHAWYGAYLQELPAVYTIGRLYRLWTYDGANPFGGEPPVEMPNGFMWRSWRGTEGWAAQVDATGWGLGVFRPRAGVISGGFHPQVNAQTILAGPHDDPTGYMAPSHAEVLDWNIVYEYSYDLILDTLAGIRAYAYQHAFYHLPNAVFRNDRAHWTYNNASDTGWPVPGRLVVDVGRLDPMIIGPECGFRAVDCPTITIRMAAHLSSPPPGWLVGQLFFERENGAYPFSESQSITFPVINDGQYRDYVLNLAAVPTWTGFISRLRFDPVAQGKPGDTVEVAWISARTTTLTVQDAQSAIGQAADLRATLLQGATPLAGRDVDFLVAGSSAGKAVTDSTGIAHLAYAVPEAGGAGARAISASFLGDETYAPSSGAGVLTALRACTLLYATDRTATITEPVTLRGYLRRTSDNTWLDGKAISFSVDGTPVGSAATGVNGTPGRADLAWTVAEGPATRTIGIEFAGDAAYNGSAGEASLTCQSWGTKMVAFDRTARITDRTELKARLLRSDSVPIFGRSVRFSVDGTFVIARNTEIDGYARYPFYDVPDGQGAGPRTILSEWTGSGGYGAVSRTATLHVLRALPYVWVLSKSVPRGAMANLYAYFRRLYDYRKQEGKVLSLSIDGTWLTDVATGTGAEAGIARYLHATTGMGAGSHTVRCEFAGDAWLDPGYGEATLTIY